MADNFKRSDFITTLAWVFIILAGFTTLISILQNVMINVMFPTQQMTEPLENGLPNMPTVFVPLFSHIRLFVFSFLVVAAVWLVSAIGLLRRKNWARITFIVILVLGIAWNIFGGILQFFIALPFGPNLTFGPNLPSGQQTWEFNLMLNIMRVFTLIPVVGISVLFVWLIRKLTSVKIKGEFLAEAASQ
jgi:hypothetical protein